LVFTVDYAFNDFFDGINLDGDHRKIANERKDHIIKLLNKTFDVIEAFGTGSIPKFTALKGNADLDIIVVLHFGKHIKGKTPTQVLQDVRDALSEYRTNVRKNGQAVTLYYKTWPNVDVVPVSRSTNNNGKITHYNIPNSNLGNWIISKPNTHTKNIESKSTTCGYNFRRIIKMVKWWNLCHGNFLQSYHVEVIALKVLDGNLDDTPWHIYRFFEQARPLLHLPLWYDTGYVDDYLIFDDRQKVLKCVDAAIEKSREAWLCTYDKNNNYRDAIKLWRQVFGENFPPYG
jgi:SMODS domain-containing protein